MDAYQRVRAMGIQASSPADLLAVGLARQPEDVPLTETVAQNLMRRYGALQAVVEAAPADLGEQSGLDPFELLRAQALFELGRRSAPLRKGEVTHIDSPQDVQEHLQHLAREKKEHFVAVLLDAKNGILRTSTIHIGTLTMSVVGAREVFREAVREGASSLIVAHNHPSGDPTPSPEDIEVTRRLVEVGELLDIPVLDHVIIGERRCVSLKSIGAMK